METRDTTEPTLRIYASYSSLPVRAVAELMGGLTRLSDAIVNMHAESARVPVSSLPNLEIEEVHTGQSIKFTFGEGWVPSVTSNEENDIVIDVPKKVGIPLLVGYILLSGAQKCLNVHKTHLDNELKKMEIQLKQTELRKTIMESDRSMSQLVNQSCDFITVIQRNEVYQIFKINGVSVLQGSDGTHKQGD